jgi:hypothetical protein
MKKKHSKARETEEMRTGVNMLLLEIINFLKRVYDVVNELHINLVT